MEGTHEPSKAIQRLAKRAAPRKALEPASCLRGKP